MVMPMCSTGVQDMFEPNPWNFTKYAEFCHKKYNVHPLPQGARIEYGGDRLRAASNIVFSNGLLDPWAGGKFLLKKIMSAKNKFSYSHMLTFWNLEEINLPSTNNLIIFGSIIFSMQFIAVRSLYYNIH